MFAAETNGRTIPRQPFIAGSWDGSGRGGTRRLVSPIDGSQIAELPLCDAEDLNTALAAAESGQAAWAHHTPSHRAQIMDDAARRLLANQEEIARAVTTEVGKTLAEARDEVELTSRIVSFFARRAAMLETELKIEDPAVRHVTVREPIGPIAAFSPWNYPVTVPARKIFAALAAGCSVIIKPAEEAPSGAVALAMALKEAGLPDGALGVVFGDPAQISETLIAAPSIRAVSFTGSTRVGRHIAGLAAQFPKPCSLELGGHAPVLVFDDVDIVTSVGRIVGGKFHNNAQSCGCPSRILVHEAIYDDFVEHFVAAVRDIPVGNPFDPTTRLGPLIAERRVEALESLVNDAEHRGANVALRGGRVDAPGWYVSPSIVTDVPVSARIMNEEPFGPVAAIAHFTDEDDALAEANRVPYGLGAYLETTNEERMTRVPRLLQAGMISINGGGMGDETTFFGGVRNSGYGSDGGTEALDFFLQPKLITWTAP